MVHMCKIIISLGVFHFFQKFDFQVVTMGGEMGVGGGAGGGGEIKVQKRIKIDKKFCLSHFVPQER